MIEVEEVRDRLCQFGYEIKEDDDETITFDINKVENEIKNICNTNEIPYGLKHKAIDKVCGCFLGEKLASGSLKLNNIDMNAVGIKTVTEGDTTVSAADGGDSKEQILSKFIADLREIDKNELYKYRKFVW